MRTCIYASGNVLQVPTGELCQDVYDPTDTTGSDPLIDWSDSIDVTTSAPMDSVLSWLAVTALVYFMARR